MKLARLGLFLCCTFLLSTSTVSAGLYYSGEIINELPSKWQGFIQDQRLLRNIARRPTKALSATPMRQRYEKAVQQLEEQAKKGKLTADDQADLGALHVRLGNLTEAVVVLRRAAKEHPEHFKIHANLGTTYHTLGELDLAATYLREGLKFAPKEQRAAEEVHLKLVQFRLREAEGSQTLDRLFDVRFLDEKGDYAPGKLAVTEAKKLPTNAIALVQQLALWLPSDGRLLWLLAELAGAHGNVRTASAMMDGCVTEFLMRDRDLRQRRLLMKKEAQAQLKKGPDTKAAHNKHELAFKPASARPLANRFFQLVLPPINDKGRNPLFWEVITQTAVDRHYRPSFPKYLKGLDGKQVQIKGYVQPLLGGDLEMTSFLLIEYPVGCWYCEVPELAAMMYVELPSDDSFRYVRGLVQISGKLKLNATNPEDFLYHVRDAKVKAVDP